MGAARPRAAAAVAAVLSGTDDSRPPEGSFFGRRKGHALRPARAGAYARLGDYALDIEGRPPAALADLFDVPVRCIRLEIGFGSGEHLLAEATRHPDIGYLGAEPFVNGMAAALSALAETGLRNVRLHHGDAAPLLDWLADGALDRVDLLYPDPWRKRRHWKRRFVGTTNVPRLARVIRPGGEFRVATDWADYAAWALAHLVRGEGATQFRWQAECADDWRRPWDGWPGTRYEAKAIREERQPVYLAFERV